MISSNPQTQRTSQTRIAMMAVLLLALVFALVGRPPAAYAATITVAAGEVAINANGQCSLREAIVNANADAATHADCVAGSGADTITLTNSTYNIGDSVGAYLFGNNGTPAVTTTITIDGNSATINRSAGSLRLFIVTSGGNLTLNNLSLTNGAMDSDRGGGAVHNNLSTLTLNNVTLSGNSGNNSGGGAISAEGGTTTVNDSTFTGNHANNGNGGGAIYINNGATLNVTDSTFNSNTAANTSGGAIRASYTGTNVITVTGSTVNGNTANSGGGIGLGAGTLTVTNSTISGNTAQANGGGIDGANTTVTFNNVTITGNTAGAGGGGGGGGIYSNTTINFNRTIVSGNLGPSSYDSGYEVLNWSTDNANNYNVFGHSGITTSRAFAGSFTPGANDVNATSNGATPTALASILNTTLAANGGPTQTHALVANSPAVDRAPSAACTAAPINDVDQRGYARNIDGNAAASANECDAGSFEYLSSPPPPPSGTIVIVKSADPADDTPFSFTENILSTGFTLTDPTDDTETFNDVPVGTYTVTEDGETGWTLDTLVCDDVNSVESVPTKTATINLEDGETVTCTFTNSRDTGTIIIVKDATPADDTPFSFTEDILSTGFTLMDPSDNTETFNDVPTGSYSVTEDGEAGWTLDDIDCDDVNSTDAASTATVNLEKGETVTCTFSNSRDTGTIIIVKAATPADDTPFSFTEDILSTGFTLTDPSDNTETFNDVPTSSYSVTEDGEAGWTLDDIDCDDVNSTDAGSTATVNLEKGETVTCTFSNSLIPVPAADIFVSTRTAGMTSDGLVFGSEDIIMWDGSAWSMWFDGSAAGLTPTGNARHDTNAFWIPDPSADYFVLSFTQNRRTVPGIVPKVDGMDLVAWDGSAFSLYFDGSDVDLNNKTQEKIDGLHILPGSESPIGSGCIAYLLISTQGPGRVTNGPVQGFKFGGEDVLGFCATSLGEDTDGLWHIVIDGSAEGMPRNSTDSISLSDDGQTMYLTTQNVFNVDAAAGGHSMVYEYDFGTGTFSGPIFSAPAEGLPEKVDGLELN